ncbi:unnamed protein product [Rotaria socialis]|uniref:Uncharacterized protein n=1 Tax=Rotaria socialis TaxID=392032 RepID=A0A820JVU9_9BILA|nr:unnamed protein product [Rotaria socialis]CAF3348199.1 unnamed protein product [Rotaria socialis]CAF3642855.1 unnamed protein product [Rotaria socialis]CAF4327921.1 unnamed protein product [Rotaria socialis]CAF4421559.1 unnamed protein product [Rotaria socialis]
MHSSLVAVLILVLMIAAKCQAGTVSCVQSAAILECPSIKCNKVGLAKAEVKYPSNCFVIGPDHTLHTKYYRLNMPGGGYGYVSAVYCAGSIKQFCPES